MTDKEYFEWNSKMENIDTYIIDSVSLINSVCYAIIYKVHYLLLFYCRNNLMQLYTIFDEITKINDYNSLDIFVGCDIVYIDLLKFSREYEFLVVQCINITEYIDTVYTLRFYTLEISEEFQIIPHHITYFEMNRLVKDVEVVNSSLKKDDLYVIILANEGMRNDSIIYLIGMNCTQSIEKRGGIAALNETNNQHLNIKNKVSAHNCFLSHYDIYTGLNLNLDQFIVNSFMFIDKEPLLVVSVDNFGLLVIDIVSKTIVDKLCFTSMIKNFPNTFSIIEIIPVGKTGIRILFKNSNGFSLFWKGIAKIGDQEHVFVDLAVSEYHVGINDGERTNLIDNSKSGFTRLIYKFDKNSNIFEGSVRTFIYYFHEKTKIFKDINFGKTSICIYISHKFTLNRIVLVCGSKIYVIRMQIFPSVLINRDLENYEYLCTINSENSISLQSLNIYIQNEKIASIKMRWLIGIIFISIIIFVSLFLEKFTQKISKFTNDNDTNLKTELIGKDIKDIILRQTKSQSPTRNTPKFCDFNDDKMKNDQIIQKDNSVSDKCLNSPKTNVLFSLIREKNKLTNFDQSALNCDSHNKFSNSEESIKLINDSIQNYSLLE